MTAVPRFFITLLPSTSFQAGEIGTRTMDDLPSDETSLKTIVCRSLWTRPAIEVAHFRYFVF